MEVERKRLGGIAINRNTGQSFDMLPSLELHFQATALHALTAHEFAVLLQVVDLQAQAAQVDCRIRREKFVPLLQNVLVYRAGLVKILTKSIKRNFIFDLNTIEQITNIFFKRHDTYLCWLEYVQITVLGPGHRCRSEEHTSEL